MSRVKRGVTARARHKKIIKLAKGYRGRAKNCFRVAIEKVEKGSLPKIIIVHNKYKMFGFHSFIRGAARMTNMSVPIQPTSRYMFSCSQKLIVC